MRKLNWLYWKLNSTHPPTSQKAAQAFEQRLDDFEKFSSFISTSVKAKSVQTLAEGKSVLELIRSFKCSSDSIAESLEKQTANAVERIKKEREVGYIHACIHTYREICVNPVRGGYISLLTMFLPWSYL